MYVSLSDRKIIINSSLVLYFQFMFYVRAAVCVLYLRVSNFAVRQIVSREDVRATVDVSQGQVNCWHHSRSVNSVLTKGRHENEGQVGCLGMDEEMEQQKSKRQHRMNEVSASRNPVYYGLCIQITALKLTPL